MNLSASTTHLTGKAASSAAIHVCAYYRDINHRTGVISRGSKLTIVSNTEIAIVAAPDDGITRVIEAIDVAEAGGANEELAVSISTLATGTYTPTSKMLHYTSLASGGSIHYTDKGGWNVMAADGTRLQQVAVDA
jgi:hypothetical protein